MSIIESKHEKIVRTELWKRNVLVKKASEAQGSSDDRETAGACQVIRGAPIGTSHPDVVCVNLNKFS